MMQSTRSTPGPGQRETGQSSRLTQNSSNQPNERPGGSAPQGTPPTRRVSWLRWLIFIIVINLIFYAPLLFSGLGAQQSTINLSYTSFLQQVQQGHVKDVTLTGNAVSGDFKTPLRQPQSGSGNGTAAYTQFSSYVPETGDPTLLPLLEKNSVQVTAQPVQIPWWQTALTILLNALPILLLVGPPGTGKTLLARAVAGEAGVPFYSASGTDFVELFVGVGASRVRDLFEQAMKNAPCIVFIDEIDAIGRTRSGASAYASNDEREQTLEQLSVELDGFEPHEAIVVLAATNRPDVLDPALQRPGRFDRQVVVDLPERRGREAILRIHTRKVSLAPDVNLEELARGTTCFSSADLANMVIESDHCA